MQGLRVEELEGGDATSASRSSSVISEKLFGDLAGNAFSSSCIMAAILSLLGAVQYSTESEDEQMTAISSAFRAVAVVGHRLDGH